MKNLDQWGKQLREAAAANAAEPGSTQKKARREKEGERERERESGRERERERLRS